MNRRIRDMIQWRRIIATLLVAAGLLVAARAEDLYPYEPVLVSTDTPIEDIGQYFSLICTIETPDGDVWTNSLTKGNLIGRQVSANGALTNTLFFVNQIPEGSANIFGSVGEYYVAIQGATNTIVVVSPTNGEEVLVGTVQGDMLPRIALVSNGNERDEEIKAKCEQVLQVSTNGRYAEYAKAYLAVDSFYQTINPDPEASGQFRPDVSAVHTNLASLAISRPVLKQMVLFHLGYAEGLAKVSNATNTLSLLLLDFPVSPWSGRASKMLTELAD